MEMEMERRPVADRKVERGSTGALWRTDNETK